MLFSFPVSSLANENEEDNIVIQDNYSIEQVASHLVTGEKYFCISPNDIPVHLNVNQSCTLNIYYPEIGAGNTRIFFFAEGPEECEKTIFHKLKEGYISCFPIPEEE